MGLVVNSPLGFPEQSEMTGVADGRGGVGVAGEEAQFSPQASPLQTGRGMIRYWSSVPARLSSWLESRSFRALREAKKAEEGRTPKHRGQLLTTPFFLFPQYLDPWLLLKQPNMVSAPKHSALHGWFHCYPTIPDST